MKFFINFEIFRPVEILFFFQNLPLSNKSKYIFLAVKITKIKVIKITLKMRETAIFELYWPYFGKLFGYLCRLRKIVLLIDELV